jgi:phytoene desaturase
MKIIIIGSGIGGLTAACLFSKDGHDVTVVEKNSSVGGKLNQIEAQGYRFDTGPSLLTMPFVLERVFDYCEAEMDDFLSLEPLVPLCRYHYPDGEIFDNYSDLPQTLKQIRNFAPADVESYAAFLGHSASIYQRTAETFLFNPLFSKNDLKGLHFSDLFKIDALSTVADVVERRFSSKHMRHFFKRFATYNGSNPHKAPGTLNVIPYVELVLGGFYIKGGMYSLANALKSLAENQGVTFQFNSAVNKITTKGSKVTGVSLEGGTSISCNAVISNADSVETYTELLSDKDIKPRKKSSMRAQEPSSSGFVMLLGCNRTWDRLKHHNIFFPSNYDAEFSDLFSKKRPVEDPAVYVSQTSQQDQSHAPEGHSNLFVLVNAPALNGFSDWKSIRDEYADKIIVRLQREGLIDLENSIEFKHIIDPQDFLELYGSHHGSIYGLSSNNRFSAFLRPRNKSTDIEGLYLVGGSTHPGGGIPLVTLSAFHAHELFNRTHSGK